MKKRFLSLILAGMLSVTSLAACGSNSSENASSTSSVTAVSEAAETSSVETASSGATDVNGTRTVTDSDGDEENQSVTILGTVAADWKTGVEMEALTAVSTAALTIYDMCKAVDRGMRIGDICLLEKDGGRSGHFVREKL